MWIPFLVHYWTLQYVAIMHQKPNATIKKLDILEQMKLDLNDRGIWELRNHQIGWLWATARKGEIWNLVPNQSI